MQKTFEKPFRAENAKQFSEALTTLNNKIDAIKKNITYLDIYNIVDTVTQKERLASQINALAPNSSLIINTEPFYLNDVSYNTGDIILKNSKGETVHINAQPGGIYFPSKIIKDGENYSLKYTYDVAAPTTDNATATETTEKDEITQENKPVWNAAKAKRITFEGLSGTSVSTSYIYGLWQEFGDGTFSAYTYNDQIVQPYIKFYLVNNSDREEIVLEYTLTEENNKWIIGGIDDSIKSNLWIKVK